MIGGALYVIGGRTVRGGNGAWLDRYDPRADRWDRLAPMPQASGGLAAGAVGRRIWVFGGEGSSRAASGVFPETWIYDTAADCWAAGPAMRTPRPGLGGAAIGNTVYAVAGARIAGAAGTTGALEALTV